jgi:hypothetical protein
MNNDSPLCRICGEAADTSVVQHGGIHSWCCTRHFKLHDLVSIESVRHVDVGSGSFLGFAFLNLERKPIATFAYKTHDSANRAREAMVKIVVESVYLLRSS